MTIDSATLNDFAPIQKRQFLLSSRTEIFPDRWVHPAVEHSKSDLIPDCSRRRVVRLSPIGERED